MYLIIKITFYMIPNLQQKTFGSKMTVQIFARSTVQTIRTLNLSALINSLLLLYYVNKYSIGF